MEQHGRGPILQCRRCFFVSQGFLTCADKANATAFREFIESLDEGPRAWACRSRREAQYVIVRAEPIRPPDMKPAAALNFFSTGPEHPYLWVDVADVLGLTRAEGGIVQHLVSGKTAEQIAVELDISVETVRTHIRRVYAKLNVRSREQFFSLVSPFRIL